MRAVNLGDDAQNVAVSQAVDTNGHGASGRNQVGQSRHVGLYLFKAPKRGSSREGFDLGV